MRIEVKKALRADAETLLARGLRPADVQEIRRVSGLGPAAGLLLSLEKSAESSTILVAGRPVAMFGLGLNPGGQGQALPWLLGHADFERPETAVAMGRICRKAVEDWSRRFDLLFNLADREHKTAQRFLTWLGFRFEWERTWLGPHGDRLVLFWK